MLKFRAWDKISKCMCDVDFMNLYDRYYIYKSFDKDKSVSGAADFDSKSMILMQSTRLCDKNGKEIFKGDIVKPVSFARWVGYVEYSPAQMSFIINKHNNDCPRGSLIFLSQFARKVEIIGNIYENVIIVMGGVAGGIEKFTTVAMPAVRGRS